MALPILDGNQTAATLSTIITGGAHIPAHTVVSLGSQAISDITSGVSGSVVSISNFPTTQTIAGTVTANGFDFNNSSYNPIPLAPFDEAPSGGKAVVAKIIDEGGNNLNFSAGVPIAGTVTANVGTVDQFALQGALDQYAANYSNGWPVKPADGNTLPISGTVTANVDNQLLTEAFNYYGTNWSEPIPVSIVEGSSSITVPISGTVTVGAVSTSVTVSQIQGTSVTTSNFTSTTASTTLASANASRRGLTVFNEGAGNLHICAGATATTIAYQVRLSAGDYWECPLIQTSLTHSAQFASSGTARVVEIL